jgi:predicted nucleotidyltransferase
LLDASDKIEPSFRLVYSDVDRLCAGLGVDYLVVGAAARDLVLEHVYGAQSRRATEDIDFGLRLADWRLFDELRAALVENGYRETKSQHRMVSPNGIKLDVIPFGEIADADANIAWPPDGEIRMNVLGFKEAHDHSDLIRIQGNPEIRIRVATPIGMTLLKLIAWNDRSLDKRRKDALDLQHLLNSYYSIPEAQDAIYADPALGERHGWDVELMSADLLGRRARKIAHEQTAHVILALGADSERYETLLWEMSNGVEATLDRSGQLLGAFFVGFRASD